MEKKHGRTTPLRPWRRRPRRWGQQVGSRRLGGLKFRSFFFRLPPTVSLLFSLSLCVFSCFFWWCLKRRRTQMYTFGVLWLSCEAPAAPEAAGGSHNRPRAQTGTLHGPSLQKHQNSTQGPHEGRNCGRRRNKKREILEVGWEEGGREGSHLCLCEYQSLGACGDATWARSTTSAAQPTPQKNEARTKFEGCTPRSNRQIGSSPRSSGRRRRHKVDFSYTPELRVSFCHIFVHSFESPETFLTLYLIVDHPSFLSCSEHFLRRCQKRTPYCFSDRF